MRVLGMEKEVLDILTSSASAETKAPAEDVGCGVPAEDIRGYAKATASRNGGSGSRRRRRRRARRAWTWPRRTRRARRAPPRSPWAEPSLAR